MTRVTNTGITQLGLPFILQKFKVILQHVLWKISEPGGANNTLNESLGLFILANFYFDILTKSADQCRGLSTSVCLSPTLRKDDF